MPMYEFECEKGHRFECLLPMKQYDAKRLLCPDCRVERKVERVASTTGFPNFKGAGFYQNTYKRSESMDKLVEQSE